jgi:hypothetical protein
MLDGIATFLPVCKRNHPLYIIRPRQVQLLKKKTEFLNWAAAQLLMGNYFPFWLTLGEVAYNTIVCPDPSGESFELMVQNSASQ